MLERRRDRVVLCGALFVAEIWILAPLVRARIERERDRCDGARVIDQRVLHPTPGGGAMGVGAPAEHHAVGICGSEGSSTTTSLLILEQVAIDPPACPGDELGQSIDAHLSALLDEGPLSHGIDASRLALGDRELGLVLATD